MQRKHQEQEARFMTQDPKPNTPIFWNGKDKRGEIHEWTAQFKLDLIVEGKFICSYRIDFMVMHNDGRMELIEVKGAELADWRRKWDLVKALLPSGLIPNVPNDAKLTLVKKGKRGFESSPQILNYK